MKFPINIGKEYFYHLHIGKGWTARRIFNKSVGFKLYNIQIRFSIPIIRNPLDFERFFRYIDIEL